jgi:methyl-accepting chemotaxis protein
VLGQKIAQAVEDFKLSVKEDLDELGPRVQKANASASEEMVSSSEELSSQAEQLQDTISFFKESEAQQVQRIARPLAQARF